MFQLNSIFSVSFVYFSSTSISISRNLNLNRSLIKWRYTIVNVCVFICMSFNHTTKYKKKSNRIDLFIFHAHPQFRWLSNWVRSEAFFYSLKPVWKVRTALKMSINWNRFYFITRTFSSKFIFFSSLCIFGSSSFKMSIRHEPNGSIQLHEFCKMSKCHRTMYSTLGTSTFDNENNMCFKANWKQPNARLALIMYWLKLNARSQYHINFFFYFEIQFER